MLPLRRARRLGKILCMHLPPRDCVEMAETDGLLCTTFTSDPVIVGIHMEERDPRPAKSGRGRQTVLCSL